MAERGAARNHVNQHCDYIKRMLKWAVSMEILPATVYQALSTYPRAQAWPRGRHEPVLPVADDLVDDTLPFLSTIVADLSQPEVYAVVEK